MLHHEVVDTDIPGVDSGRTMDTYPIDAISRRSEAAINTLIISINNIVWGPNSVGHAGNRAFCAVVQAQDGTGGYILSGPDFYIVGYPTLHGEGSHQPSIAIVTQGGIESTIAGCAVVASLGGVGHPILGVDSQMLCPFLHRLSIRLSHFKTIRKGIGVDNGIMTFSIDRQVCIGTPICDGEGSRMGSNGSRSILDVKGGRLSSS
ncbi:MAG: hypothetical protein BWY72_02393 [Bacteroidetes bacterium ADurb.Bin416]|nr:MAG: hypothetical protein BWY72_02393 [Bacteroidetes bacterium ADurb.Bin416]